MNNHILTYYSNAPYLRILVNAMERNGQPEFTIPADKYQMVIDFQQLVVENFYPAAFAAGILDNLFEDQYFLDARIVDEIQAKFDGTVDDKLVHFVTDLVAEFSNKFREYSDVKEGVAGLQAEWTYDEIMSWGRYTSVIYLFALHVYLAWLSEVCPLWLAEEGDWPDLTSSRILRARKCLFGLTGGIVATEMCDPHEEALPVYTPGFIMKSVEWRLGAPYSPAISGSLGQESKLELTHQLIDAWLDVCVNNPE